MFEKQKFTASVYKLTDLPKSELPQIVLCGRSNVGKSSFINSLFNQKNLAKTSSTPGKTRSINFYDIDSTFFMVDLPGYGYAKVSQSDRQKWGKLINDFFAESKNIVLVFHLIDCRHNPTELDIKLNQMLKDLNLPYNVILNKSDKLKQSEVSKSVKSVVQFFPELIFNVNLFLYSSVKGTGKKEIKKLLLSLFN
ncbi:MAG: YihA family ribosome biogenesis GTP-binding protein [Ignavibacteriota bacterium]|nr:YihA family ribosome biogenesis GTP-binding protein [Ignavibacteriota bacterium]MCO6448019.1 YihA family ribosome biogenesis GTP-binding protein [Ignavibacterium album]QKJ98429.1 MAG: YihA family ribosome biogenesis GTP-binding protein [Ignavibacteriota bacterium]HMN18296.1 ribosome biogenesis GTP-binding protein YihA/YsxC [Ignavibacteriaceae bacterium]HOJ07701.1 ribosome biogenesis GTP-binding protein YihA/YsxC [Ignavibacteriaceae bacterium]